MPTLDEMIAAGTLDIFGLQGGAIGNANIAALGYLPRSLIIFTQGPNKGLIRFKQSFSYSVNFTPIAANTTTSLPVNIQPDSDFVVISRTIAIQDPAAAGTFIQPNVAPFLVLITDTGAGVQLQDVAQPVANLFGTGQDPNVLLGVPVVFRRGGTIQVQLTNQDAANARNVRMSFNGFKVFDIPAESRDEY